MKLVGDQKTLFLGLELGSFAALLLLCGGLPVPRRFVEAVFPYSASGYYIGDLVFSLGWILGTFVFPVVLTSIAQRFYALWGFLPIFLLMLCLIVGCLSAHQLSFLFDPSWVLPLITALSWAIASFPIALFRFLRQRRKHSTNFVPDPLLNPLPPSQIVKPVKKQLHFFAPLALFLAFGIVGWYNIDHPRHFQGIMQTDWLSGKASRIPLVEQDGGIYVNAWLNNQKVLCKVDTGAESVQWSRGLHVEGRRTSSNGENCDLLGACVATQTVLLPHLKIGSYEITNIPTSMSDAGSGPFTPALEDAVQQPLLGNTAFVRTVLTVDYKNAILIIRPPQYNFMQQPRKAGDRILEMGWSSSYPKKSWRWSLYGTPAVEASLGGAPFWCTLDTGAGGPEICLTKALVDHNPFIKQVGHETASLNAASSSAQVERLDNLTVKFPCSVLSDVPPVAFKLNGLITPTLKGDDPAGTGVIGLPLMKRYRITIDYGRGRVLLEPYS